MKPLDMAMIALTAYSFLKKEKKKAVKKEQKAREEEVIFPSRLPAPEKLPETTENTQRERIAQETAKQVWDDARKAGGLPPMCAAIALYAYREAGGQKSSIISMYQKTAGLSQTGVYDKQTTSVLRGIKALQDAGNQSSEERVAQPRRIASPSPLPEVVDDGSETEQGLEEEKIRRQEASELELLAQQEGFSVQRAAAAGLDDYASHEGESMEVVAHYQQKMGIPITGIYDDSTRGAVARLLNNGGSAMPPPDSDDDSSEGPDPQGASSEQEDLDNAEPVPMVEPPYNAMATAIKVKELKSLSGAERAVHDTAREGANISYRNAMAEGLSSAEAAAAYLGTYLASGGMVSKNIAIGQFNMGLTPTGVVDAATNRQIRALTPVR